MKHSTHFFNKAVAAVLTAAFLVSETAQAAVLSPSASPQAPLERLLNDPRMIQVPSEFAALKDIHVSGNRLIIVRE